MNLVFRLSFIAVSLAVGLALAAAALPAAAQAAGPGWMIAADAEGTAFKPDGTIGHARYIVVARNVGSLPAHGTPITITDQVPTGLTITEVNLEVTKSGTSDLAGADCGFTATEASCGLSEAIAPEEKLVMVVRVSVSEEPSALGPIVNLATISGGGGAADSVETHNVIASEDAPFGIASFLMRVGDTAGNQDNLAGAHPYETTTTFFTNVLNNVDIPFSQFLEREVKDTVVDLPPGLIGNPTVTPTCTLEQLGDTHNDYDNDCPAASQIGTINPYGRKNSALLHELEEASADLPLYNIAPEHGRVAEFGFTAGENTILLYASVVPTAKGYVVRISSPGIQRLEPLHGVSTTFFGDPGSRNGTGASGPFLVNGADCGASGQTFKLLADLWSAPGAYTADGSPDPFDPNWKTGETTLPQLTGCNQLAGLFKPSIEAKPETNRADSPTGLEVNLNVPRTEDVKTLATPPLKKAVITLPEGMSVNPSSANGLEGCSLADLGMSASGQPNASPPHCPDASKIGTVELETPALPGVLGGQIYVAKQRENPFNTLLAIYIVVNDPTTGVIVKLPAEVRADPVSGQLTTVVDQSPQFPFSELRTRFFGGQRAALRTPAVCGTHKVTSTLTPWSAPESGPPATPASSFSISQAAGEGECPGGAAEEPDKPFFEAGAVTPLAGAYSPFVLRLSREDGSQELNGLNVALPPGLIGKLAGISECPEGQIAVARSREREGGGAEELASPSCPPGSEVGTVTVGAGAGLTPYYAHGHAYLAGPYKGAPLSLAIITPAVAGPYDLGDVVVRAALQVDPASTQITAVSDEIPHILDGIPLDVRSIALQMNRPDFTLNPTNCEKKVISGTATTVLGQSAPLADPFQVGGCKALKFKPKLSLRLKGGTRRRSFPALKATLTYPKKGAYANIAQAQVTLPHAEFLEQGHIGTVCTQAQLHSQSCPAKSIYGRAKAWSPLLDKPLEGPVYLGVGYGHTLPDLVADLNGQIRVLLNGKVDTGKGDGLRNTFLTVPDAPVSKFTLELFGGKRGLIVNSENLCSPRAKTHAIADFTAQNGKVYDTTPKVSNSCKHKHKGKDKGKKHKAHKRPGVSALLRRLAGGW